MLNNVDLMSNNAVAVAIPELAGNSGCFNQLSLGKFPANSCNLQLRYRRIAAIAFPLIDIIIDGRYHAIITAHNASQINDSENDDWAIEDE